MRQMHNSTTLGFNLGDAYSHTTRSFSYWTKSFALLPWRWDQCNPIP